MSRWVNTFQSHGFTNTLRDLTTKVDEAVLPQDADENTAMEFGRIKKVITYINEIINSVDPELVSPYVLNEMQGQIQNSQNQFTNYMSNKDFGHLQNTNGHLDFVLNVISRTFVYYRKPSKSKIKDIVKSYSDALDQHRDNYKEAADREVNQLSSSIKEEVGEINSQVLSSQENIRALNEQANSLNEEISQLEKQAQIQLTEFNNQFQSTQSSHQKKMERLANNINKEAISQRDLSIKKSEDLLVNVTNKINQEFVTLTSKAGAILEALGKLQENAEAVFGVVQNTVQAGAHKEYADEERKTANLFRYGTIVLMLLAVAVLIVPEILRYSNEDHTVKEFLLSIDWSTLLRRLPISAVIFAPAFYFARESSKHRQNEFQNRRRELTLRTIDPYLALIKDEGRKDDLKGQIAQNIFGEHNVTISQGSDSNDAIAQVSNLVHHLSKFMPKR